jgi:hypothetical protein
VATEAAVERQSGLLARLESLVANPFVAYGAILALQLRLIWDIWRYRDLTFGDTSYYFLDSLAWTHGLRDNFADSPLYGDFLGTIVAIVGNAYTAVIAHRVLIVLAASLLVLALMRALLGPTIGLLAGIWWVVLPPNYDVAYEVHLFGLLPVLVAALLVVKSRSRGRLGLALAILVAAAALLRNELVIAAAILAIAILVYERRQRRAEHVRMSSYLRAYVVPLSVVVLAVAASYWRSVYPAVPNLRAKHELNVCEAYAFSYQQRHPSAFGGGNAMVNCSSLMRRQFDRPRPTFSQALAANPSAIARFVAWNVRLLPSGLQVALFGATQTGDQPDYFLVKTHRRYVAPLSVLFAGLLLAGLIAYRRQRDSWLRVWLRENAWAVVVLGAVAVTTTFVILTQRPRPEYMYGLTIAIFVVAGLSLLSVLRALGALRFGSATGLALIVVLLAAVPSHYHAGVRPLHDAVARLHGIRDRLREPGAVLVAARYNAETCAYLADRFNRHCTSPSWSDIQAELGRGSSLRRALTGVHATALYAEPYLAADPAVARLIASPATSGWRRFATGVGTDGPWAVLVRDEAAKPASGG